MNTAILGIGSNYCSEINIKSASEILQSYFTDIRFSAPLLNKPVNIPNPAPFLNRTAILKTELGYKEITNILKLVEKVLGRTSEDKKQYKIKIDIDLIQWNNTPLKPDDLQRPYISAGLKELGISNK